MYNLLGTALVRVLELIELAIFIRVIISWIPVPKNGQFMRILYQITEPILAPIRSMIERSSIGKNMMMLDFSPIIAFLLIGFLKSILARVFGVVTLMF